MHLNEFNYDLPESFIAQTPVEPRDSSRLLVLHRDTGQIEHRIFREIGDYLRAGDVLVVNNTRVIPARLHALKTGTGGSVEILLLQQDDALTWRVLAGGRRVTTGVTLHFPPTHVTGTITAEYDGPLRQIRFSEPIQPHLAQLGEMPLPPYIHTRLTDAERYQTVYSRESGSAAAPTAGLHFTPELLLSLRDKGVKLATCTLHIGLDTFQPVKVDNIADHKIHKERAVLDGDNAKIINEAKLAGGRIIAVGTTAARTLETAGILSAGGDPARPDTALERCAWRPVIAFDRETDLFITPGYTWRAVDVMVTNFHLPKSTLMMMLSALVGRERLLAAYEVAKTEGYRFFFVWGCDAGGVGIRWGMPAHTDPPPPCIHNIHLIHVETLYSRTTNHCQLFEFRPAINPRKMFCPHIETWVEQTHALLCHRINPYNRRTFRPIANRTSKAKVFKGCWATF